MATKNSSLTSKWQVTTIRIVTPTHWRPHDHKTTHLGSAGSLVRRRSWARRRGRVCRAARAAAAADRRRRDAAARHLCRGLPRLARVPRFRALGGPAPGRRAPGVALGRPRLPLAVGARRAAGPLRLGRGPRRHGGRLRGAVDCARARPRPRVRRDPALRALQLARHPRPHGRVEPRRAQLDDPARQRDDGSDGADASRSYPGFHGACVLDAPHHGAAPGAARHRRLRRSARGPGVNPFLQGPVAPQLLRLATPVLVVLAVQMLVGNRGASSQRYVVATRKSSPLDGWRRSFLPEKYRRARLAAGTCRTSSKPASRASVSISAGRKKLMKGVPDAAAPFRAGSAIWRSSGSMSSTGGMKVIASMEPGASAAIWRSVAAVASLVRYTLTPVDATIAG